MTEQILEPQQITIIIPKCCRENWDSCTHVPPKKKKQKRNIGL